MVAKMINKNKKPKIVNVSSTDFEEIQLRVLSNTLSENDKKIIIAILTTYHWIYNQLQTAKLGMRRLKSLFGFKTEKNPANKSSTTDIPTTTNNIGNKDPSSPKTALRNCKEIT